MAIKLGQQPDPADEQRRKRALAAAMLADLMAEPSRAPAYIAKAEGEDTTPSPSPSPSAGALPSPSPSPSPLLGEDNPLERALTAAKQQRIYEEYLLKQRGQSPNGASDKTVVKNVTERETTQESPEDKKARQEALERTRTGSEYVKQQIGEAVGKIAEEQLTKQDKVAKTLAGLDAGEKKGETGKLLAQLIAGVAPLILSHALRGVTGATAAEASYGGGYAGSKALEAIQKLSDEEKERVNKLREIAIKAQFDGDSGKYMESIKMLVQLLGIDVESAKAFLGQPLKSTIRTEKTTEKGSKDGDTDYPKLPAGLLDKGKKDKGPTRGDQPVSFMMGRYVLPAGLPQKSYEGAGEMTASARSMAENLNQLAPLMIQQGGKNIVPSEAKGMQKALGTSVQNLKKAYENYGASLTKLEAELGTGLFGSAVKTGFSLDDFFDYLNDGRLSAKQLLDARRIILRQLDNTMVEKYQATLNRTQRELDAMKPKEPVKPPTSGKFQ